MIGGDTKLINSTITENTSPTIAGGIWRISGAVELINTLLAKNTAPIGPDCSGLIISLGHNFVGHSAGCDFSPESTDVTGTVDIALDPKIGPLQNYGGPNLTHALLPGSLAIDNGDDSKCEETDQRGVDRPQGSSCDIGAYELAF